MPGLDVGVVARPSRLIGDRGLPVMALERIALDPAGRQWRVLGPERAIGCVYWVGAEGTEPGVIRQDGKGAALPIGEPRRHALGPCGAGRRP